MFWLSMDLLIGVDIRSWILEAGYSMLDTRYWTTDEDYKRHKVQGILRFEVGGKKIEMRTIVRAISKCGFALSDLFKNSHNTFRDL